MENNKLNDFVQLTTKSWFYLSASRLRFDQNKIENNSEKNTMAETRPNLIYIYRGQVNESLRTFGLKAKTETLVFHWPLPLYMYTKLASTWLESPRMYIPISQMSPNHVQSRASPGLIFSQNFLHPFVSFQGKAAYED